MANFQGGYSRWLHITCCPGGYRHDDQFSGPEAGAPAFQDAESGASEVETTPKCPDKKKKKVKDEVPAARNATLIAFVKEGIKNVYQLKDGVLGYRSGSVEDSRHWEGNLFVFDDTMVVSV